MIQGRTSIPVLLNSWYVIKSSYSQFQTGPKFEMVILKTVWHYGIYSAAVFKVNFCCTLLQFLCWNGLSQ